jgi:hypothetical protein
MPGTDLVGEKSDTAVRTVYVDAPTIEQNVDVPTIEQNVGVENKRNVGTPTIALAGSKQSSKL